MSERGSRPKIPSGSVTEPEALPSSVVTFNSMSRTLLLGRRGGRFGLDRRLRGPLRQAELAGHGQILRELLLDRVAQRDPAALGAGHRALDQDEAALEIGLHHLEIERGHPIDTHMTWHLLVLERLARVLASAGRSDRAMRD